ncbi:MAG: hypothetical protein GY696_08725 [Gammaproteobacteria bacterium]|nr:hypothetical protein [Gammaproteobacteria bacterium]
MRQTLFVVWFAIGGVMQCCFLNAAFAIPLERPAESLIHGQQVELRLSGLAGRSYNLAHRRQVEKLLDRGQIAPATALAVDEIDGSFLLESTPIDEATSLPSLESTLNSQQLTADLPKTWHGQSSDIEEFEQTGYDDYWDTFNGSSVIVGDVLRLYVNTGGGGGSGRQSGDRIEGSGGQRHNRKSPGLIRDILNISFKNEHAGMLISVLEPWQDRSGRKHFSVLGIGDFVMEHSSVGDAGAGRELPYAGMEAQRYGREAVERSQSRNGMVVEQLTLTGLLLKFVSGIIGWPLLFSILAVLLLFKLIRYTFRHHYSQPTRR